MIPNGQEEQEEPDSNSSGISISNDSMDEELLNNNNCYESTAAGIVRELHYYQKDDLFDISNKTVQEIQDNMTKNEIINFNKLPIMKEIKLFNEIAEIYKKQHKCDILNTILFLTKFSRIQSPQEIYQNYAATCIKYNSIPHPYNDQQYRSLCNFDKLKYFKDLINACRYLMLNIDPMTKEFISDLDYFKNEYLYTNLTKYENIYDTEILTYTYFTFYQDKYKQYLFTDDLKNRITKFLNKNGNGNVDLYFSSYIDDIYNMNIETIKKNMTIEPINLFKEDVLSLNPNIPDDLIESLYKNHLPFALNYIYILKANRISFMAKYKNIKYGLNLDDNLFVDKNQIIKNTYQLYDYIIIEQKNIIDNCNKNKKDPIERDGDQQNKKITKIEQQNNIIENDDELDIKQIIENKIKNMKNQLDDHRKAKSNRIKRELRQFLLNKYIKKDKDESNNRYKKFKDDFDTKTNNTFDNLDLNNKQGLNSK